MTKDPLPEITAPVDLSQPDGRVNPAAVGWTRHPHHRANLRGWGRNKRFDYWCITTPELIVTANVSHHDYRANVGSVFVDLATHKTVDERTSTWLPRTRSLPDTVGGGPVEGEAGPCKVRIEPTAEGTRIHSESPRLSIDLEVVQPPGHESMGVLVPWSERTYQWTQKNNSLPTTGTVVVDGEKRMIAPGEGWAIHDHGRGRWPYHTRWNWAAGHGESEGQWLGLQFGGKWTTGTPSTENALRIDGRLHKIHCELEWDYDVENFMAPWRISGDRVDLTFQPVHHSHHFFNRYLISARGDQCFGHFNGEVVDDDGRAHRVKDVFGLAEEVERRW